MTESTETTESEKTELTEKGVMSVRVYKKGVTFREFVKKILSVNSLYDSKLWLMLI